MAKKGYRLFPATLAARTQLAKNFVRLTFADPQLSTFGAARLDQRFKLVLADGDRFSRLLDDPDWFRAVRQLPDDVRPAVRTYTVRHVRPELGEVDVDFVTHGTEGPASSFALEAPIGSKIFLAGPDQEQEGADTVGIAWTPGSARKVLIAGDETAVPAIGNILEALGPGFTGAAFIEVPDAEDIQDFPQPDGMSVRWLPRRGDGADYERGERPCSEVLAWADAELGEYFRGDTGVDIPDDGRRLWDPAEAAAEDLFVWIAADAETVATLRRGLRKERGLPAEGTSFMGYWRVGSSPE